MKLTYATEQDIANMPSGFTVPAGLAERLAKNQKRQEQQREQDQVEPSHEHRSDRKTSKY